MSEVRLCETLLVKLRRFNMRYTLPLMLLLLNYALGGTSIVYEECNPMACLYHYNSFFASEKDSDPCKKFGNLKSCIKPCLEFMPTNVTRLYETFNNVEKYVCYGDLSGPWDDKCPAKRKFQLMLCLYEALNMDSLMQPGDSRQLDCKKIFVGEFCSSDTLGVCKATSIEFVEGMLLKFTDTYREEKCNGYSIADTTEYKTKSLLHHLNVYHSMSKCFDVHHEKILSCVSDRWITNYVENRHNRRTICNTFQEFLVCAKDILATNCDKTISKLFTEVGGQVFDHFMPDCSEEPASTDKVDSFFSNQEVVHSIPDHITDFPNDPESPKSEVNTQEIAMPHSFKKNESEHPPASDVIIIYFDGTNGTAAYPKNLFISQYVVCFICYLLYLYFGL